MSRKRRRQLRVTLTMERLEDRSLPSAAAPVAPGNDRDSLYVGDGAVNTVKRFDAATGQFLGNYVSSGSGNLNGPRGMIFRNPGEFMLVDQNVGEPNPGDILRFNGPTGNFRDEFIHPTDPNMPFAPRGMVLGPNHTLFIADDGNLDGVILGRVARFNSETGAFLGDLQPTGFTGDFYARSVVIGPDGLLYATVRNIAPTGGEVMSWDPATGNFLGVFVASDATNDLNRPEGIAFGPDGNIYVASFRANAGDTDKVLEFSGATGAYIDKIDLDQVGQPRAFAQAILFGPGGDLFVPITGNGPDTGAVRRYDVHNKTFTNFVAPDGTLGMPWYLTFGHTDPGTLAYVDHPGNAAGKASSTAGSMVLADPISHVTANGSQPAVAVDSSSNGQTASGTSSTPPAIGITSGSASTVARDNYFAHYGAGGDDTEWWNGLPVGL